VRGIPEENKTRFFADMADSIPDFVSLDIASLKVLYRRTFDLTHPVLHRHPRESGDDSARMDGSDQRLTGITGISHGAS